MLDIELCFEDGSVERRLLALPIEVGRAPDCHLRLKGWRVARRHARFERRATAVFLEDFGSLAGTLVNGQRIAQYGPLAGGDEVVIGPCLLRVLDLPVDGGSGAALIPSSADTVRGQEAVKDSCKTVRAQSAAVAADAHQVIALMQHRKRLHAALLEALDLRRRDVSSMSDAALREEAMAALGALIEQDDTLPKGVDRRRLLVDVVNEAVALGPLESLLADPSITEIMVNRHDEIFVESDGRLARHWTSFSSEQAVLGVIERIVSPLGRRIDESSPMVDARLADGSRVNAVIAPVALRGTCLTIRKFPANRLDMDDLLKMDALSNAMATFLSCCVRQRKNVIVSGGTGSGKTTLLNILSNCIPEGERVITIEDAAELQLHHSHLVAMESRPANLEGRGRIEVRDLVRNALRMRPDRIVIGECRGGEAFDMLAAMNTGHEGSLTTLHANSPRDALARLETMILMAGMELPLAAVREHIAGSIDFIVQQARLSDGRRKITSIVEVTGLESGRIQTQELFRYVREPRDGFTGCGVLPESFTDDDGRPMLPADLFAEEERT
ncbi:ATPase, T2SS/T4P/T4SS family [Parapusillimonas sp. JC17]|uniref:ATPase, T2SS/T4P/T4SS family n=1 Tax=Parapusillimonas sp. JC17 TaxID=3445768 RepID=UPI003F9FAC8A